MSTSADRLRWTDKEVFTTGEAAEICRISQQTIIRCFDSGRLCGFRVPGSRFRRIPRTELIRFMRRNEIPTDALESTVRRVLVVDDDLETLERFRGRAEEDPRLEVRTATTGYDAGLLTEQFRPQVIVLGLNVADLDGARVCERIKANPDLELTRVVLITDDTEADGSRLATKCGADAWLGRPVDPDDVLG